MNSVWSSISLLRYADRWTRYGTYTQPDPCAPAPDLTSEQWQERDK
ncbi:MAG: hypothetical protein JW841_17620 [Deltaproteobacteria bacterium]|nr:hypothetical protein [Deltaproteobacteria bacterium]